MFGAALGGPEPPEKGQVTDMTLRAGEDAHQAPEQLREA